MSRERSRSPVKEVRRVDLRVPTRLDRQPGQHQNRASQNRLVFARKKKKATRRGPASSRKKTLELVREKRGPRLSVDASRSLRVFEILRIGVIGVIGVLQISLPYVTARIDIVILTRIKSFLARRWVGIQVGGVQRERQR